MAQYPMEFLLDQVAYLKRGDTNYITAKGWQRHWRPELWKGRIAGERWPHLKEAGLREDQFVVRDFMATTEKCPGGSYFTIFDTASEAAAWTQEQEWPSDDTPCYINDRGETRGIPLGPLLLLLEAS